MRISKSILIIFSVFILTNCENKEVTPTQKIIQTNGLVAFWDFQNADQNAWQSTYDEKVIDKSFPLYLRQIGDPKRYHHENWPYQKGPARFTIDETGPFGHAVRFNQGYIYGEVPREEFDKTLLDLSGNKPFTMIAWAKFLGNRHMIAGIWDEGGWNKYSGRRQAALFAGLFNQKGVIGHVSSTGAASFPQSSVDGAQYARLRAIDAQEFSNGEWVSVAMSFDPEKNSVKAYLNGQMTEYFLPDPVTQDVMQYTETPSANPFEHKYPLYSPTSFLLKYNGYDFHNGPIKEHRLWIDLENSKLQYQWEGQNPEQEYRIHFEILRENKTILNEPIIRTVTNEQDIDFSFSEKPLQGDMIVTSLETFENEAWIQVGEPIERIIMDGAPFTFGRALGLDEDSIEHGSVELYLDGVAVFNRVLKDIELKQLSFIK